MVVPDAPQPAWLARTLPLSQGMWSYDDGAALSCVVTPPVARLHPSDAVASGPPICRPFRAEEPGCRVLGAS